MKHLYELNGEGRSIRGIARDMGVSRNSVRKYLRSPQVPKGKGRASKESKLDPHKDYLQDRVAEGLDNCVVLLREIRERGYTGGYSILKEYVHPFRRKQQPQATMRFETEPGQQAQVDWGSFSYVTPEGQKRSLWAFVMVLSWSRAMYVELVRQTDVATFIRCHLNAFEHLGGVPRQCLYDNAKVVVLGREDGGRPRWNPRFLDFSLRVGFDIRLCQPYRAQTKGRVESGIKYLRWNCWPSARFADLEDLNRQVGAWCDSVANVRLHGTTRERPRDRLIQERSHLTSLPDGRHLLPFLREERKVGRDGYVQWKGSWYGVPWRWSGKTVEIQYTDGLVELWSGERRLAAHPRAHQPGQRFTTPGQWAGLPNGDGRPRKGPLAVQVATVEVEQRALETYEALVLGGGR